MEPKEEQKHQPPLSDRPSGKPIMRRSSTSSYSKPSSYRASGGFRGKHGPPAGAKKWIKKTPEETVVKEPEKPLAPMKLMVAVKRIYTKEVILSVSEEPLSKAENSINPDLLKRRIKTRVQHFHRPKHHISRNLPRWCMEVRKNSDATTRGFKSLLNKLAPTNFTSILEKIKLGLSLETVLTVAILIFEKASNESRYSETYALLCKELIASDPPFKEYLLATCQNVFESSAIDFNLEGLGEEEAKEKTRVNRSKILGCVRFIGELTTQKVISPKRFLDCCHQLLFYHSSQSPTGQWTAVSEDCIEGLCYLISSCPVVLRVAKYAHMTAQLHSHLQDLYNSKILSSRITFFLLDVIEMGSLKLLSREKTEGPKILGEKQRGVNPEAENCGL